LCGSSIDTTEIVIRLVSLPGEQHSLVDENLTAVPLTSLGVGLGSRLVPVSTAVWLCPIEFRPNLVHQSFLLSMLAITTCHEEA
jgi:hypothetical protein